ncbi:MAG: LysR family transcriptional regulator [Comamonadaceae bacterium]|nr:MAG: LysR family transcriptional regulator [Comamonadaceae bacterium]
MRNATLRQLRIFESVATTLSYSRAAELLHLTQPAVSMQMSQLQKNAGQQLFLKVGKRLVLSPPGEALLRHTRRILDQVRIADEAMSASRGGEGGLLHLGVVPTAHYFAPALLMAFRSRHPGVRFKLTVERREKILAMLQEHQLDVAIGGYPPSEADVEAETFARNPHCIVAPPSHPLVAKRQLGWDDLRSEDFIFREPGSATRQFLEHLLQSQSLQVNVSLELSGNETIKQAVMVGMGISFLSAHVFQVELAAGLLKVLDLQNMPKMLDWCLLHRRDAVLSGLGAAFRDFVRTDGTEFAVCRV